MRLELTKFTAIFMICLVLTLPMYAARASAANVVNVIEIKGKDGIPNIRATEDDYTATKVAVKVDAGNASDLANNLEMAIAGYAGWGAGFSACADAGANWYDCTYTYPETGFETLPPGRYDYTVTLFPGKPTWRATDDTFIVSDGVGPTVKGFKVTPNEIKGGDVTLQFTIEDTACASSECSGFCAGIAGVEIYNAETGGLINTLQYDSAECSLSKQEVMDAGSFPNGDNVICVIPFDRFNQVHDSYVDSSGNLLTDDPRYDDNCVRVKKDDSPPSIATAGLYEASGKEPITYVSSQGTRVKLVVNLSTNVFPLKDSKILVDLSSLGNTNLNMPCTETRDKHSYTCEYSFIARVDEGGGKAVQITAEDSVGNSFDVTAQFTLEMDSTPPTVIGITTNHIYNGEYYLGASNNYIYVDIAESGSGFTFGKVDIGVEGASLDAEFNCAGSGSSWRCSNAEPLTVGATGSVGVRVTGEDDVGFQFSNNGYSQTIIADTVAPTFVSATVESSQLVPYVIAGDAIIIRINITDDTAIVGDDGEYHVSADFSNFADDGDYNPKANSCTLGSDERTWTCEWQVQNIQGKKIKGKFNITDFLGNSILRTVSDYHLRYTDYDGNEHLLPAAEIQAYTVDTDLSNLWDAEVVDFMPSFVDGETAAIIPYMQWFKIRLDRRSNAAEVAFIDFAGCQGEDADNYLADVEFIIPDPTNQDDMYIKLTYNRGQFEQGKETLGIECSIAVTSLKGDLITQPELENLTLTTPVMSIGDISDEVWDEIEQVTNSWLVQKSFLWTLERWINLANNVCTIINTIFNAITSFQSGLGTTAAIAETTGGGAIVGVKAKLAGEGMGKTAEIIDKVNNKFCKYLSCEKGLWKGPYDKFMGETTEWVGGGVGNTHTFLGKTNLQPTMWPRAPKNSLILSMATGCLPGILYNLNKARQIECQYVNCLYNDVARGVPYFVCVRLRNYGWCKYIYGEIFQLIPFANFVHYLTGTMRSIMDNPISMWLGISQFSCTVFIPLPAEKWSYCWVLNMVAIIGDVIKDLIGIKNMDWSLKDSCGEILDAIENDEYLTGDSDTTGEVAE